MIAASLILEDPASRPVTTEPEWNPKYGRPLRRAVCSPTHSLRRKRGCGLSVKSIWPSIRGRAPSR